MTYSSPVAGLLLAAGAGTRMGMPKALVGEDAGDAWVVRGARLLLDSGCSPVVVVVGARADDVTRVLDAAFGDEPRLRVQRAERWSEGMSASLRAGLDALLSPETRPLDGASSGPGGDSPNAAPVGGNAVGDQAVGVVVTLVDTPGLLPATLERVRAAGLAAEVGAEASLARAVFGHRPGHPVYLGRSHWAAVREGLAGDEGAGVYLREHGALTVECADLETGDDIDSLPRRSHEQVRSSARVRRACRRDC